MKRCIFFLIIIYNSSINAETYKCNLQNNQNIVFDRSGHSHFKKCIGDVCDKNIYPIIHLDERFLIFGNIDSPKKIKKNYFQLFIINKEVNSFLDSKIKLPNSKNIKIDNEMIIGNCLLDEWNNIIFMEKILKNL